MPANLPSRQFTRFVASKDFGQRVHRFDHRGPGSGDLQQRREDILLLLGGPLQLGRGRSARPIRRGFSSRGEIAKLLLLGLFVEVQEVDRLLSSSWKAFTPTMIFCRLSTAF